MKDQFGGILACEFNQIIFEYNSVGPDMKTPVRMTGTINIPRKIFNKENDARHLLLYNQFTHAQNGEKMSEDSGNELGLFMTESLDCIAISTDSYGWTLTKDKPQAYCCPEIYAAELNGQLIKLLVDVQTHPEKYKELFDSIKSLFDGQ